MIAELLVAVCIAIGMMLVLWGVYLRTNNPGVVDVGWGLGILLCGQWYLANEHVSSRIALISLLLLIWGGRLTGFLWYTRIKTNHIDRRYLEIANSWKIKREIGFLGNFMIQALLLLLIALPLFFISHDTPWALIDCFFICCIIIGIAGETIADWQLYMFKQAGSGEVCDRGLWYYSRHPNYFFEIMTWVGFALLGFREPYGYIALLSPMLLIVIMVFITGRITERVSLQSKGALYEKYQRETSMIVPLPKRRS